MDDPADESFIVARNFQNALDILNDMSYRIETIWNIGGYNPFDEGLKSDQLHKVRRLF